MALTNEQKIEHAVALRREAAMASIKGDVQTVNAVQAQLKAHGFDKPNDQDKATLKAANEVHTRLNPPVETRA